PLGTRALIAAAVALPEEAPPELTLRPIRALLDPAPASDERLCRVAVWMAGRYRCSLGEALQRIMPESYAMSAGRALRLTPAWPEDEAAMARWSPAIRHAAAHLRKLLLDEGGEIELTALKRAPGVAALLS